VEKEKSIVLAASESHYQASSSKYLFWEMQFYCSHKSSQELVLVLELLYFVLSHALPVIFPGIRRGSLQVSDCPKMSSDVMATPAFAR
jgi:hypothetical protein